MRGFPSPVKGARLRAVWLSLRVIEARPPQTFKKSLIKNSGLSAHCELLKNSKKYDKNN